MTLRWVPGWNGLTEPEAVSYVATVEAADGQELEFGVAKAINDFVLGCKNDGIWDAIKASCILAGARTLAGALVPLMGTAPTNYNFVSGDYNRETGLIGDGSTKYLDSGFALSPVFETSNSAAVYTSTISSNTLVGSSIGTGSTFLSIASTGVFNYSPGGGPIVLTGSATGFIGTQRNNNTQAAARVGGTTTGSSVNSSTTNQTSTMPIFCARTSGVITSYSSSRLAFYSIGESLDLAALDTRVSDLITAIGAAIP